VFLPVLRARHQSAERAVDRNFVQGALENGELLIIEFGHEILTDPAGVGRHGLRQSCDATIRERNHDAPSVGAGVRSTNEAFINPSGDSASHARPGDERVVRQLRHAQLAVGDRQLSQHVVVGQGKPRLLLEVGLELAHEGGVGSQERSPGPDAAPAGQFVRNQPLDEADEARFRKYLHAQPDERKVFASANISAHEPEGKTVIAELLPDVDPAIVRRFGMLADDSRVRRAAAALEANGISVLRVADAAEAKEVVLGLIPDGSEVHHGASMSLDVAGITDEIDNSGRYESLRPRIFSMDRQTRADEIRRLSSAPDVMLGSVHAVTETGSLMAASMGGSQLGPYVSGAGRVILVVGTQKIVSDIEEGLRRIEEYAYPLEDARAQAAYGIHSGVNKVLIINREITPGRITVIFVDEVLGF
jgi:hypothetical protein